LQEQICELSPTEKVTETSDAPDYNERITLLRYALERYTNFDSDEDRGNNIFNYSDYYESI
jgi:hypothetical protein